MASYFQLLGAVFAGLAVAAGAFGSHGLKDVLSPERLAVFETAVRYQMYHALALFILGAVLSRDQSPAFRRAAWSFAVGIVLFSGSLYAITLTGMRWFGAITPIGGVAFLIGWIFVGVGAWKQQTGPSRMER